MAAVTVQLNADDKSGTVLKSFSSRFLRVVTKSVGSAMKSVVRTAKTAASTFVKIWANAAKTVVRSILSIKGGIVALAGVAGFGAIIKSAADTNLALKAFSQSQKISKKEAAFFGRELVQASLGTLSFLDALQLANRSLTTGSIKFKELALAINFIAKIGITSGLNLQQAFNRVITGLVRGTPLVLDDFGVLIDGIEGVQIAFDKVNGKDAFSKLLPSEQKLAIQQQAFKEMATILERLTSITGKDLAIQLRAISGTLGSLFIRFGQFILDLKGSKFIKQTLDLALTLGQTVSSLEPGKVTKFFGILTKALARLIRLLKITVLKIMQEIILLLGLKLKILVLTLSKSLLENLPIFLGGSKKTGRKIGKKISALQSLEPFLIKRIGRNFKDLNFILKSIAITTQSVVEAEEDRLKSEQNKIKATRELNKKKELVQVKKENAVITKRKADKTIDLSKKFFPAFAKSAVSNAKQTIESVDQVVGSIKRIFGRAKISAAADTVTRVRTQKASLSLRERIAEINDFAKTSAFRSLSKTRQRGLLSSRESLGKQARFLENLVKRGSLGRAPRGIDRAKGLLGATDIQAFVNAKTQVSKLVDVVDGITDEEQTLLTGLQDAKNALGDMKNLVMN